MNALIITATIVLTVIAMSIWISSLIQKADDCAMETE